MGIISNKCCLISINNTKSYSDCRILPILISFRNFRVRKCCTKPCRISQYFESFVNQIFGIQNRENADHSLHKVNIHCEIWSLHIHPTPYMIHKSLPTIVDVVNHFSALLYILLYSKLFLHLLPARNTKLFIHCIFCGNTMTVPSSSPLHAIATHCHPSWHKILHRRLQ